MKFVFAFAVLALAAIAVTECIVCTPNFCDMVRCAQATEEECSANNQTLVKNGGTCGCCDICRTIIKKGENCNILLLRSVAQTAQCEEGTSCQNVGNSTWKCEQ